MPGPHRETTSLEPMGAPRWPDPLHVAVRAGRQAVIISPTGEIDMHTAPVLRAALDEALRDGPALVVVDLRGVRFMGSTALQLLSSSRRRARATSSELRLAGPSRIARRILDIIGARLALEVYETVDDAAAQPVSQG